MAIAFSTTPTVPKLYTTCTVNVTGATAATHYTLVVTHPDGFATSIPVLTDGSGAASAKYTPNASGTVTYALNTVVAQSATATGPHSS